MADGREKRTQLSESTGDPANRKNVAKPDESDRKQRSHKNMPSDCYREAWEKTSMTRRIQKHRHVLGKFASLCQWFSITNANRGTDGSFYAVRVGENTSKLASVDGGHGRTRSWQVWLFWTSVGLAGYASVAPGLVRGVALTLSFLCITGLVALDVARWLRSRWWLQ